MKLDIYEVDAFASRPFTGNPAAVVPLDSWLEDSVLQAIAEQNNLSETAFFVADGNGYHLRWFTPGTEIELCGHATLASAYVLFELLGYRAQRIRFNTLSGELIVDNSADGLIMDLPLQMPEPKTAVEGLLEALGCEAVATVANGKWLVELADETAVRELRPDFSRLAGLGQGVIVTARGDSCDFVSRFFAPHIGINEDPVTGSAHAVLVGYWAGLLGKTEMKARQLSARGGELLCRLHGDRVIVLGRCRLYLKGQISI